MKRKKLTLLKICPLLTEQSKFGLKYEIKMKQINKILLLFIIGFFFQEQVYSQKTDSIYFVVDSIPDFKYNKDSSKTYVELYHKVIKYYQENSKLKVLKSRDETSAYKGLLILSFIVEKDGTLTIIEITTKGFETDKTKIEMLLRETEKWTPARLRGKTVRMRIDFPLYVNLEE
jgi:hypothetical protein